MTTRPNIDDLIELPHDEQNAAGEWAPVWHLYVVVDHDADPDWFYAREVINRNMETLGELVEVHAPGTYGEWRNA